MNEKSTIDVNKIPLIRKLLYSLIPLVAFLLLTEIGLRIIFFQISATRSPLASIMAFNYAQRLISVRIAQHRVGRSDLPVDTFEKLFAAEGALLLAEFKGRYEKSFKELVLQSDKIGTKLIIIYIPSDNFHSRKEIAAINRQFFSDLSQKHDLDFIDLTGRFLEYPADVVTLLPEDGHLSRFGNKVVADELGKFIKLHYGQYYSDFRFSDRPKLFGDLRPNDNSVWEINPAMPYRVIVNRQGLRMSYDLAFPKEKQRVLILGDSLTFGPFLDNHDTYPELLNKKYPDKEFINAGVAGYTITDQASLFIERAKYVEPDITVLQVIDNDLPGLFYFKLNEFDRQQRGHEPTELERQFLEELRQNP